MCRRSTTRELRDDLVILVFLFVVKVGFHEFPVAFIEVLKAGKGRADDKQVAVFEREDLRDGDGKRVGKIGLAAVECDLVEAARERRFLLALASPAKRTVFSSK